MTVSINSKLLEAGYGDKIHMLNVQEAMGRLRLDFRDSVRENVEQLRRRFSSRNETASTIHPVAIIPVLYRPGTVLLKPKGKALEVEPEASGMTISGGMTVLAWAILAEVDEIPAINLDEIEDASELVAIAAGSPEALWPARFQEQLIR